VIDTTSASRPIQTIGTPGGLDHQPRVVRPRNLSHIYECTNGSERARSHGRTNGVGATCPPCRHPVCDATSSWLISLSAAALRDGQTRTVSMDDWLISAPLN
jgi:hypothetical protein